MKQGDMFLVKSVPILLKIWWKLCETFVKLPWVRENVEQINIAREYSEEKETNCEQANIANVKLTKLLQKFSVL